MFPAFVGFTLATLPPLLFVAYCRSLLAQASEVELSATVLKAIATESGSISVEDFCRLKALVGLCPLGQKDEFPLAAVSNYFFLLTLLYAISSRTCGGATNHIERERQRCFSVQRNPFFDIAK